MTRRRPRPPSRPVPRVTTWQAPEPSRPDEERELFERAVEAVDGRVLRSPLVGKGGEAHSERSAAERGGQRSRRRAVELAPLPSIDLHGCDRATAIARLERFLAAQPRGGTALVIHGKGEQVLAAVVTRFLGRHARVLAHEQAPRRRGGAGARLVTLR